MIKKTLILEYAGSWICMNRMDAPGDRVASWRIVSHCYAVKCQPEIDWLVPETKQGVTFIDKDNVYKQCAFLCAKVGGEGQGCWRRANEFNTYLWTLKRPHVISETIYFDTRCSRPIFTHGAAGCMGCEFGLPVVIILVSDHLPSATTESGGRFYCASFWVTCDIYTTGSPSS
jgi:hypothetical protein